MAHGAKVSKAGQILELVKPCLCMQIIVYTMKISAIDISIHELHAFMTYSIQVESMADQQFRSYYCCRW